MTMPIRAHFLIAVLVHSLAHWQALSALPPPIWGQFHNTPEHSGLSLFSGPRSCGLAWTYRTTGGITSSPAIGGDGVVYFGAFDNSTYAINCTNGEVIWTYTANDVVVSSPAVNSDNVVYFGSNDGNLYALDGFGGYLLWKFAAKDKIESSPAIGINNTVYFGSWDGYLYSVDGYTGELIWKYKTGPVCGSPAVDTTNDAVFVGTCHTANPMLYSIFSQSGTLRWSVRMAAYITGSAAVGINATQVYVGCQDNFIYSFASISGHQLWKVNLGGLVSSSPAVSNTGKVYITAAGTLFSLNAATGDVVWSATLYTRGGQSTSSPAVDAAGVVYVGGGNTVFAFDSESAGKLLWKFRAGSSVTSSPAIGSDGFVFVGALDATMYAFNSDGKPC